MNAKKCKALRKAMRMDERIKALPVKEYVEWKQGRIIGFTLNPETQQPVPVRNANSMRLTMKCQRGIYQRIKRANV